MALGHEADIELSLVRSKHDGPASWMNKLRAVWTLNVSKPHCKLLPKLEPLAWVTARAGVGVAQGLHQKWCFTSGPFR